MAVCMEVHQKGGPEVKLCHAVGEFLTPRVRRWSYKLGAFDILKATEGVAHVASFTLRADGKYGAHPLYVGK